MTIQELVEKASTNHDADGGSSTSLSTGNAPQRGYMVSIAGHELKLDARHLLPSELTEYLTEAGRLDEFRRMNDMASPFLGTWYDDQTKRSYVDISVNVPTLREALEVGRRNNQLAVYDVQAGESIRLK